MEDEGRPSPTRRLGLFGGTFDPPHIGHLIVATEAAEHLGLERLLFVPAATPPHKSDPELTPAEIRLEMVRATVHDDPLLGVTDVELRREGRSYTVDTLRHFREEEPDAELWFLTGVDQLAELHAWKEPDEVARLAHLGVMARKGREPDRVDPGVEVAFEVVPVTRVDVSSTLVRERVREGCSIRWLVPEPVRRIIEREALYVNG